MPKFVIEREVQGAGKLSAAELKVVLQRSCAVMRDMGSRFHWQQSYVTDDKVYCVYIAESEKDVLEHARKTEIPANRVSIVRTIVDPATAE
jgi:hypothetical protein